MPSHGIEIINGIPIILKGSQMTSYEATGVPAVNLGTYDTATKTASWQTPDALESWLQSYRQSLAPRLRKAEK